MRKLTLRSEHLSELTTEDLRRVAGAGPQLNTVSDGSCVCTDPVANLDRAPIAGCDVSDGSCVCFCPNQTS